MTKKIRPPFPHRSMSTLTIDKAPLPKFMCPKCPKHHMPFGVIIMAAYSSRYDSKSSQTLVRILTNFKAQFLSSSSGSMVYTQYSTIHMQAQYYLSRVDSFDSTSPHPVCYGGDHLNFTKWSQLNVLGVGRLSFRTTTATMLVYSQGFS